MNKIIELIIEQESLEIKKIRELAEELRRYCSNDKDTRDFVHYLLEEQTDPHDKWISSILGSFCYSLGCHVQRGYAHCLEDLCSLIGNYFLDDSYYSIDENAPSYQKAVRFEVEGEPCYQGASKLLQLASLWADREVEKWSRFEALRRRSPSDQ